MKGLLSIMAVVVMLALLFTYPTVMIDILGAVCIIAFIIPLIIGVGQALRENNA